MKQPFATFTVGSIAQVGEVILACRHQGGEYLPFDNLLLSEPSPYVFSVKVVAKPMNPSPLPIHQSTQADIISLIIESGCLEWTTTANQSDPTIGRQ